MTGQYTVHNQKVGQWEEVTYVYNIFNTMAVAYSKQDFF